MNTSKPNPHTITPTTVMESDFDEPTPHRKPGKSTGRPRSRHKHIYTEAWYVHAIPIKLPAKQHCFIIRSVTVRFVVESVVCR